MAGGHINNRGRAPTGSQIAPKIPRHLPPKVTLLRAGRLMPGGAARLCRANGRFPYTGTTGNLTAT